MPLSKPGLIAALTNIFKDVEPDTTPDQKAQQMADAIEAYVKSGTVQTTVTVASVAGVTPGPGASGPGTGTGVGSIT